MDILEKHVSRFSVLSPDVMKIFVASWQHWTLPKDHLLVREHQVCDYIFFIKKGVTRIYYYKNEKEITEWIAMDEQFFLSPEPVLSPPAQHPQACLAAVRSLAIQQ